MAIAALWVSLDAEAPAHLRLRLKPPPPLRPAHEARRRLRVLEERAQEALVGKARAGLAEEDSKQAQTPSAQRVPSAGWLSAG